MLMSLFSNTRTQYRLPLRQINRRRLTCRHQPRRTADECDSEPMPHPFDRRQSAFRYAVKEPPVAGRSSAPNPSQPASVCSHLASTGPPDRRGWTDLRQVCVTCTASRPSVRCGAMCGRRAHGWLAPERRNPTSPPPPLHLSHAKSHPKGTQATPNSGEW